MGKITEEELGSINEIKKEALQTVYALGELEYQRLAIELNVDEIKQKIRGLRTKEADILNQLKTKYGNVNINIETGEFE
jgi:hypothetical protein